MAKLPPESAEVMKPETKIIAEDSGKIRPNGPLFHHQTPEKTELKEKHVLVKKQKEKIEKIQLEIINTEEKKNKKYQKIKMKK